MTSSQVIASLQQPELKLCVGPVFFKFEPFILHVQCRSLEAARLLLTTALDAGMRNSGIVLGRHKIMVGIRMTLKIEAPVAMDDRVLVSDDYLKLLTDLGNQMFAENTERTERFFTALQLALRPAEEGQAKPDAAVVDKRTAGLLVSWLQALYFSFGVFSAVDN